MDQTQAEYEKASSVAQYAKGTELQLPEQAILARFRHSLPEMDMLDLGVGTGRTALHFAPLVRSYLGVDYSAAMIRHCKENIRQYQFEVADARSLSSIPPSSYDLVLFSYNGIDSMNSDARQETLFGIKRILRPGGLLVFSSHNANRIGHVVDAFRFRFKHTIRETLRSLKWSIVFAARNPTLRFRLPCPEGFIADGLNSFRSEGMYYIRPDRQTSALRNLGMMEISCVGSDSRELMNGDDPRLASLDSPWVYYVCRKPREQTLA